MTTSTLTEKVSIFDPSGKVRAWFDAGRGVRHWRSQEIGAVRPDQFTPADNPAEPPHWAYKGGDTVLAREDCTFYERMPGVKQLYTDSPAGWRAAERKAEQLDREDRARRARRADNPHWQAYRGAYTVERITLAEVEYVDNPDGQTRRVEIVPRRDTMDSELNRAARTVLFRVAVVEWIAKVE